MLKLGIVSLLAITLILPTLCYSEEYLTFYPLERDRVSIGYYKGQAVENNFGDLYTSPWRPIASYIQTVFINYQLNGQIRDLIFETEGQLVKHNGLQDHWETNGLLVVRLKLFDQLIPTSIATGHGLSYATEVAKLDKESGEEPPRILYYFYAELAFGLRDLPYNPRIIFRIHHRSGVFGLYCGQNCGSNIPAVGFRSSL
ncbi:MAG: hypothetical protein HOC09_10945 [Deltaproteobacteria bacterium]|nr:hypothetical protein [Deltaproteobacteria bacterium]